MSMRRTIRGLFGLVGLATIVATGALAQGTQIQLDTGQVTPDQEIEITAEALSVNRDTGEAVFTGDVRVSQGDLRLAADKVLVRYAQTESPDGNRISEVTATGNVVFASGTDAAESAEATFLPDERELRMTGDVLLKQGAIVVAGNSLVIDLTTGTGQMQGRVRTVLQPSGDQ